LEIEEQELAKKVINQIGIYKI